MALTERTADDKIEIVGDYKHIQIRQATIIERDGVEISRGFHRRVVGPLDDVSGETAEVQATCCTGPHGRGQGSVSGAYRGAATE
jgi:hypothetical protein